MLAFALITPVPEWVTGSTVGRIHIWFQAVFVWSGACLHGHACMKPDFAGSGLAPAMSRHRPNCSGPTLTSWRAVVGSPLPIQLSDAPAQPAPTVGSGRKVI